MGFSKTDPYGPEEPPPERNFPDLLTNQTVAYDRPPADRPPGYVPRAVPPAAPPQRFHRRPPAWPSLLLLIAIALIVGSLLVGWWSCTVQYPNRAGTFSYTFYLGSQLTSTCTQGTDCSGAQTGTIGYSSFNLGAVGDLYGGALALMLGALLAGIAATCLALAGSLGYWVNRRQTLLTTLLALLTFGLVLGATLWVAALQPGALSQDSGGITAGGAPSPATEFWGSCSGAGVSAGACTSSTGTVNAAWGAAAGWYLALAATIVLLLALVLHIWARPVRGSRVGRRTA
jgi:hypothetical protein